MVHALHAIVSVVLVSGTAIASEGPPTTPDAAMLRYPDIGPTDIVFVFANDLWLVDKRGGVARPLTTVPGSEVLPKFSPDGARIAFVGNYDGGRDLYVMPSAGGNPDRITHHPAGEALGEWTNDGRLVFTASGMEGIARASRLYAVKDTGGLPQALPVPYGANGTISPDGEWLAYTPHSIDNRTWKRYRGGMQTDIWIYNLRTGEAKRITDHEGIDTLPMWQGKVIYYLSDDASDPKDAHKLNIWSYDTASGTRRQVTRFTDDDVKWPSIGNGEIVFQKGSALMVLDLASGRSRTVDVKIPGDRPTIRPSTIDVASQVRGSSISPGAKRVAVSARGDIWTAPAEHGVPRNLTATDDVAERSPAWSPDGRWIACFSDETGEYELWLIPANGKGERKRLTTDGGPFKTLITWFPDSSKLCYQDKTGAAWLVDVESGERRLVDREPWDGGLDLSISHDGAWIAYAKSKPERRTASIWIQDVVTGDTREVTSGMFRDSTPVFDRAGDWLYFSSQRGFGNAQYSELDTTWVYQTTERGYAVPLRTDVKNPWAVEIDEEMPKERKDAKKDAKPAESEKPTEDKKPAEDKKPEGEPKPTDGDKPADDKPAEEDKKPESDPEPTDGDKPTDEKPAEEKPADDKPADEKPAKKGFRIDFDGFEQRVIELPLGTGRMGGMAVNDKNQLIYAQSGQIKLFDLKDRKREPKKVTDGMGFELTADGKKLLAGLKIMDAAPNASGKDVVTQPMLAEVDPRREWKQVVRDAWRIFRDYFYDPTMHGVDWVAVGDRYLAMVPDANSREDVGYIISEMISELNVGHAYYTPPPSGERTPAINVGLLGVDWETGIGPDGASVYRIKHVVRGADWDADARNPLKELGVDVKAGEYVLAVNGAPLDTSKDPWSAFQGLAGKTISLTVGPNPSIDDQSRTVVVKPLGSEDNLRYRDWIEANRRYVAEKSGGKVGYVYVPNTGVDGQSDMVRQFQGERFRPALIIDDRWNGGGQIPTRFIEMLNRPITNYWARRDQQDWVWPPDGHYGPKAMMINGLAGSGGDMFPWLFRHNGLGPLVGTRTWGGLVGISGNPGMIDGSGIRVPVFAFYEKDGTWGIEGHGVDPDVEVIDDPGVMRGGPHGGGIDPQLDKAVELLMAELERSPVKHPARPAYPNREGFGIAPEDK